jgi:hypothetical protein
MRPILSRSESSIAEAENTQDIGRRESPESENRRPANLNRIKILKLA